MAYITLRDVQLAFGGPALLDGANFNLERGERVCLIGRNGEGKSTLLKLIEGSLLPDSGEVSLQNGITISMLAQDVPMDSGKVADIVADGAGEASEVLRAYHEASEACVLGDMEACDRMGHLQHQMDQLDGWALETKVNSILSKWDWIRKRILLIYPVAVNAVFCWHVPCSLNLMCCYSTNQRTIWMSKVLNGWKNSC